jgi:hypothetical protein
VPVDQAPKLLWRLATWKWLVYNSNEVNEKGLSRFISSQNINCENLEEFRYQLLSPKQWSNNMVEEFLRAIFDYFYRIWQFSLLLLILNQMYSLFLFFKK